ncbi:MAG: aldehyde dehydrogenase family protein [Chloroflexi bacterium]|nr:MAG: aldehyde dehydrogenase family protein [Chloroflexota bacterium]
MATPRAQIDAALAELQARKDEWVRLPIAERMAILDEINHDFQTVAERWVAACAAAKGIPPENSFALGEEWVFVATIFRLVRLLRRSLSEIAQFGRPQLPGPPTVRPDGQVVVPVFPQSKLDRLLYAGVRGEVWLEPGVTAADVTAGQAKFYRHPPQSGQVALVLGAGNVSTLVPGDFLHALFVKGQVVALKPNPVNEYLGPLVEEGFRALVRRGFLRVVYGGVDEGAYLCHHPAVEAVHLTGSDKTFEAIVFGPGPEGARRKAERRPLLSKPVTAELGNVSPIIVVPGPWSESDIRAQAQKIAAWLVVNTGFNCITPRVIIQHKNWPHREALNRAIVEALSQAALRRAYYPGAAQRQAEFAAAHSQAVQIGVPTDGQLPWTYIPHVPPDNPAEVCFRREAFCGLLAETALAAESVPEFVGRAVEFANRRLWGTLTAALIVHPRTAGDPALAAVLDRAVADLRYGTVTVNQYGGYGYVLMLTPWGGAPGQDIFDVQSGIGMVNNTLMLARPQKAVVRSPFIQRPDPFTLTARHFDGFGRHLAQLEATGSAAAVPGLLWNILRG